MLIGIDGNEANIQRRVGVNQYAFDLLNAISVFDKNNTYQIYLKTPPLPDMPAENFNWEYRLIPFPKLWTQTRLPWDLYTHSPRPDIFFSPSHYAPRFSPVPTVISVMDLGFLDTPDQFTAKDFNQLKSWTAYSVRNAKKILTISEFTKANILATYKRKSNDVVVTYPGYDTNLFTPSRNPSVLEKYGINKPYLLFIGSLKPNKNIEGIIKAFALLENMDVVLAIAGKRAWMYDQIFQLVKDLKLEKKVIFTGFIREREVPILMSGSLVFVMPSFYEGFGIPVLEAMACGTPVVTSYKASLPEVGGEAVVYVDPADEKAILNGINTAIGPERSKFIKRGFERVKLFNWQKTAEKTISVLESAI